MAELRIDDNNSLFFVYSPPHRNSVPTFVFINALTGSTDHWEAAIAPALRERGLGTLSYNFRGQGNSTFNPQIPLTNALIVTDLVSLMGSPGPSRPILTGLSIGGLYAAKACAGGVADIDQSVVRCQRAC